MNIREVEKEQLLQLVLEGMGFSAKKVNDVSNRFSKDATMWPNSTESHSDTNRSQLQHMSVAARQQAFRVEGEIEIVKSLEKVLKNKSKTVGQGSLVEISMEGDTMNLFVIPGATTVTVDYEGLEIIAVGTEAALAESLLGKKAGDKLTINNRSVEVMFCS